LEESLRLINHAGHATFAMAWEGTVEPDWLGVIDGDGECIGLEGLLAMDISWEEEETYIDAGIGLHATAEESSCVCRCAWAVEGALCNGVCLWVEAEFNL
jgi:hypothetical protein